VSDASVPRETGPVPPAALQVAGDRADLLIRYAQLLADVAVVRGLIGPREVPRLWDRHLLNCAVVAESAPESVHVADVGTGAGLPGLVWAIVRPDLQVTLVEPLLRRTTFLEEAVQTLELSNVEVRRGRAEELHGKQQFDVVTSRAVAPLDRLSGWCLPLVRVGGRMVAMKGSSAQSEIDASTSAVRRLGGGVPALVEHGRGIVEPSTWSVVVEKRHEPAAGPRTGGAGRPDRRDRKRRKRPSPWG
jgi:16S rRNA (guanine527-N7)-methyltransferase